MAHRAIPGLIMLVALAACDSASEAPPPGAPSAVERRALDEAAEMLEDRSLPASAIPPTEAPLPPGATPVSTEAASG